MVLVERRIGLLFAFFLCLILLAGMRSLQLGTLQGGKLARAATSQQVTEPIVPAHRGTIVDRHGTELAVSQAADDVTATPYLVTDAAKAATQLAPLLGVDENVVLKQLSRRDTGFVYLGHHVPGDAADKIRALKIPGIDFTPGQRRTYPREFLASQVLGGVNMAGKGYAGVEYSLDSKLHGTDGQRRIVRDGVGEDVQVRDIKRAQPGDEVELSLDANIQDDVESVLGGIGKTYRPKGATAIVTNPKTGEILALANWPQINANDPSAAPDYARQNRAVGITYEPGSTFKAITVAGALEDHKVTPDTSFNLPPQIVVADRTIKNAEDRGWATMTTSDILAQSDNVGAITIGQLLGKQRFDYYVRKFGFGKLTGTDLPGEEQGIVPQLKNYSGSSMGNLPIGQGEAVTPMQIAQFYGAIANGGVLRTPHLVRRIDGRMQAEPAARRIMSASTAASLRTMLEGVLAPGGTASEVKPIPGYTLAGKTGTANKIDPVTHEYSQSAYVASFVGFAPARNPKLLISIMVDEPKGGIYGGQVAAPAFGKIASFALQYQKIPPSK
ncbi:penicillin-binding protein 2 [Baekduia sp.]|jgi:cell division protein FtsI (penicillin-binding protein 3)/stage V sporulation protein D (sporulation-specific penicillin-binding protein)|uniref:peptidoglycan D,D-transpeptidase FtsI family protein n=1 Tax=Baekduia sp. TaxID=2600305 RepID=UPI002E03CED9|nr:penicillin-binding protein 2 [Baekduia sp.]